MLEGGRLTRFEKPKIQIYEHLKKHKHFGNKFIKINVVIFRNFAPFRTKYTVMFCSRLQHKSEFAAALTGFCLKDFSNLTSLAVAYWVLLRKFIFRKRVKIINFIWENTKSCKCEAIMSINGCRTVHVKLTHTMITVSVPQCGSLMCLNAFWTTMSSEEWAVSGFYCADVVRSTHCLFFCFHGSCRDFGKYDQPYL